MTLVARPMVLKGIQMFFHRFMRLLRLGWLAPSIVVDICEGRQPPTLTPQKLLAAELPLDWADQRRLLGLG